MATATATKATRESRSTFPVVTVLEVRDGKPLDEIQGLRMLPYKLTVFRDSPVVVVERKADSHHFVVHEHDVKNFFSDNDQFRILSQKKARAALEQMLPAA